MNYLGVLYASGEALEQDYDAALSWFRKASTAVRCLQ